MDCKPTTIKPIHKRGRHGNFKIKQGTYNPIGSKLFASLGGIHYYYLLPIFVLLFFLKN